MAFDVADQVRVADQSSDYRGMVGIVKAVTGDSHSVRLFGHGCSTRVKLLTVQLKADATTQALDYDRC